MFDQAQLRKGTLEGCILKIIDREPTYGYAIATTLRDCGFADLTEGTLYPLLLRLERKGLIAAEYRALAFTVSGYTKAQVLKKFYDELLAAHTVKVFAEALALFRRGYGCGRCHVKDLLSPKAGRTRARPADL